MLHSEFSVSLELKYETLPKEKKPLKIYDNIIKKYTPLTCAENVSLSLLTLDKSCDH